MRLGFSSWAEVYVYITCVMLGISLLMPLNALTSAPEFMVNYYKYVTGNPDAKPNSKLFWANIFTFYNVASVVTQIIMGPTILLPIARRLSLTTRFIGSLTLMMSEVIIVMFLPVIRVSETTAMVAFFIGTIAAGAGKSYLESTCYATVSSMHPKFMSAVMFGCGFSGVIASILQCIIKVSMPDTYESALTQSHIYFSLALSFMAVSLAMALSLRYNSFAQKYIAEFRVAKRIRDGLPLMNDGELEISPGAEMVRGRGDELLSEERLGSPGNGKADFEKYIQTGSIVDDVPERIGLEAKQLNEPLDEYDQDIQRAEPISALDENVNQENMTTSEQLQVTRIWPIVKRIFPIQVACFNVFFLSLFIFPSLVIPIDRVSNWFATLAILFYNTGDAMGRWSSSLKFLWPSKRTLLIISFVRYLFLIFTFLCIYKYIPGHIFPYIMMGLIGLTNGFYGATSMVFGPNDEGLQTEGQRVMAGQLMGIALLAGNSAASVLALIVVIFLP